MAHIPSNPITRDSILAAIRSAVKKAGGKQISMGYFFARSEIIRCRFHKFFPSWNEALRAAGFDFIPHGERVPDERLLADWGQVARKLGRVPQSTYYDIHGNFTSQTFKLRFDSYRNVAGAFMKFAKGKREWADVLTLCSNRPKPDRRSCPLTRRQRKMRTRLVPRPGAKNATHAVAGRPIPGRLTYGAPLTLPGLGNAPVNESGVIFLFGILAAPLGFHVQALRTAFPDCEARRQVGSGQWQTVAIEFEYESRNFRDHGHDPKGCDLIVCWNHNWPDCPKNLEVIALSDELQRIALISSKPGGLPDISRG